MKTMKRMNDRMTMIARVAVLLVFVLWLAPGCGRDSAPAGPAGTSGKKKEIPVRVAKAEVKTVPVMLKSVGQVEAGESISVKAQVDGELQAIHFKEGREVKKGDVLFTINPAPYTAKLRQAEAVLARDRAQLDNARRQVDRNRGLTEKNFISQEEFDQLKTEVTALEATVKADQAAVESARLDLGYCTLRSAVSGVAGAVSVDQGNLVKSSEGKTLVVINRMNPVKVTFTVPEKDLSDFRTFMAAGHLDVEASPQGKEDVLSKGRVVFLDNTVDATSGTVRLKAEFANQDRRLWPGQFVTVTVTLTRSADAVTVPARAVVNSQDGPSVFIAKPDMTVEFRPVTVERIQGDVAVMAKGLSAGETVVVDGLLKLTPGSRISVVSDGESGKNPEKQADNP
jgi:multidrug efflux system membrane fusion protein